MSMIVAERDRRRARCPRSERRRRARRAHCLLQLRRTSRRAGRPDRGTAHGCGNTRHSRHAQHERRRRAAVRSAAYAVRRHGNRRRHVLAHAGRESAATAPMPSRAVGPHADEITAPHPIDVPHGLDSPVGRAYDLDAEVLLLGVGHDANTTVHLAENIAGVRYKLPKYATVMRDGQLVRITTARSTTAVRTSRCSTRGWKLADISNAASSPARPRGSSRRATS